MPCCASHHPLRPFLLDAYLAPLSPHQRYFHGAENHMVHPIACMSLSSSVWLPFIVFGRQLGRVETDERSRLSTSPCRLPSQQHPRRSGLRDADEVARGVAERAVARYP